MFWVRLNWKMLLPLIETFLASSFALLPSSRCAHQPTGLSPAVPGSVLLLVFTETQALPGGSWGKNVECDGGILNVVPFFYSFTSPLNVIIKDHLLYDLPSHVHNSGPLLMGHASLPETLPTLSFFLTPFCLFLISYPMPKARKWPWVEIVLRAWKVEG